MTGWAVGDRVVPGPVAQVRQVRVLPRGPGRRCASGAAGSAPTTNDWQGAFAGYKVIGAAEALRVPDDLSLKHAALTEPLAVALHGITQGGGARPGTRWLVTGGGPIGFLSVAALKALGVDDIVVSEPKEKRRDAVREARRPHRRRPTSSRRPRCRTTSSTSRSTSRSSARATAAARNRRSRSSSARARSCSSARAWPGPKFDPNRILLNELVITGAFVYDPDGFVRALELLASGKLPNDLLVEQEDYPLNRLLDTALGLHEGDLAAKAMIVPRVD